MRLWISKLVDCGEKANGDIVRSWRNNSLWTHNNTATTVHHIKMLGLVLTVE